MGSAARSQGLAAVTAGLTLPWSSGTVQGHVSRIKMIKRQMYGRAKPGLLRKRSWCEAAGVPMGWRSALSGRDASWSTEDHDLPGDIEVAVALDDCEA
jgi:hypothetical protein